MFEDKECSKPLQNVNPEQFQLTLNNKLFEANPCESVLEYQTNMYLGSQTFCDSESSMQISLFDDKCS